MHSFYSNRFDCNDKTNIMVYILQHKDLARENERAAEIAADVASHQENHAPVQSMHNKKKKCLKTIVH